LSANRVGIAENYFYFQWSNVKIKFKNLKLKSKWEESLVYGTPNRTASRILAIFCESFIGTLLKCQEVGIWNVSGVGDQPENLVVEREYTSFYILYRKLDKVAHYRIKNLPKQFIPEF
jgi:hypothetical protein